MGRLRTILIFIAFLVVSTRSAAQAVSIDSVKIAVAQRINNQWKTNTSSTDLGYAFYIEDISTRQSITKQKYGIFEFNLYGDDMPSWTMWYDPTGYKIYGKCLDTEMLGEMLAFLKRNKYSAAASYHYILRLYRSCNIAENTGLREVPADACNKLK